MKAKKKELFIPEKYKKGNAQIMTNGIRTIPVMGHKFFLFSEEKIYMNTQMIQECKPILNLLIIFIFFEINILSFIIIYNFITPCGCLLGIII